MFKIIGADQKEYGPVAAEQIRQWIIESRLNGLTQAQREGGAEWLPLSAFDEFADLLRPGAAAAPPPAAAAASPAAFTPAPMPTTLPAGTRGAALEAVKGPAIALIITAALGIAYYCFNGAYTLIAGGPMFHREMPANIPAEWQSFIHGMQGPLAGVMSFVIAAVNGFVLFGALKMLRLQSRPLAMAACIVAMIPCGCCCLVGIPFGIWGLVMLNKPEVKSQF
jgi:hypothetical protein